MADQITQKLGLSKPEVGASEDTWGNKINANFDTLDGFARLNTVTRAGSVVDQSGLTLNQPKIIGATGSLAGTITGVTQPVGVSGNSLATTQFVMSSVIAAATNIPGQTGKEGYYLYTDGANASWQLVPSSDFILINSGVI